jgi:hypothetical protein
LLATLETTAPLRLAHGGATVKELLAELLATPV